MNCKDCLEMKESLRLNLIASFVFEDEIKKREFQWVTQGDMRKIKSIENKIIKHYKKQAIKDKKIWGDEQIKTIKDWISTKEGIEKIKEIFQKK